VKDLAILGVGAVGVGLGAVAYALFQKEPLDTPVAVFPSPLPGPEAVEATKIAVSLQKQGIPFDEKRVGDHQFTLVGRSNAEVAMKIAREARG